VGRVAVGYAIEPALLAGSMAKLAMQVGY